MFTFIARFRRFFLFAGVLSMAINLLLIVPAVYTLPAGCRLKLYPNGKLSWVAQEPFNGRFGVLYTGFGRDR